MQFRRTTHDENGDYRKELGDPYSVDEETWVVHMLHPNKSITFQELVDEVWAYNDQEHESRQGKGSIAIGLIRLIESGSAIAE